MRLTRKNYFQLHYSKKAWGTELFLDIFSNLDNFGEANPAALTF